MSLLPGACGTILGEDVKHCLSCGAELLPPSETCPACRAPQPAALYVPVPATSVFDPPVVAPTAGFIPSPPAASPGTPAAPRPAARDTPEVRTRRTIILVSVLVLLLVLGLAAYAVGRAGTAESTVDITVDTVDTTVDTVATGTGGAGTRFSPVPA